MTPRRLSFPEPEGPLDVRVQTVGKGLGFSLEAWTLRGALGDTVPVDVYLPVDQPTWGMVVTMHGVGGHRKSPYVSGAAKRWSRDGLAIASMDAPYHGDRYLDQTPDPPRDEPFLTRTVGDLRRLCSALGSDPRFTTLSLGYLGFSMGVLVGVPFMAVDHRVRAGVFAVGGATGTGVTDPATYAPLIRRRPVLLANADRDESFDRASVAALYESFGPSRELLLFPGNHDTWENPGRRYRSMFGFFRSHLGPGPSST